MNFLLKKSALAITLSAALFLSACEKAAQAVVTPAAPVAAQTNAAQTAPAPTNFNTAGFNIVEGKDYIRLQNPQPVQTAGQSEVLEFFWYGCSHCNSVDPSVQAWKKTIPASVKFIRIHPSWGAHMEVHQKTFYTLQALNKNDVMDEKVFNALHSQQLALNTPESVSDFIAKNGIAKADWDSAYKSFGVSTEVGKAGTLFAAYGLQGVPAFVVNGKYQVSGDTARVLKVVNKLLEMDAGAKK
jgi:thiol:disulfide interchange protein DsbA